MLNIFICIRNNRELEETKQTNETEQKYLRMQIYDLLKQDEKKI